MSSLVVADLHVGARGGADLVRRPDIRAALLESLEGVDELVVLGDGLELREGRMGVVLAVARPVFEALGRALGKRRRVVLSAGNHDHRLVAPWLERRHGSEDPPPLQPEQRLTATEASDAAAAIEQWCKPAKVEVAYPGLWLAPGVYAIHGHYLDRHITVPSLEPLGVRAVERFLRRRGALPDGADGYEAVTAPVLAFLHELAQFAPGEATAGAGPSQRAYRLLTSDGGPRRMRRALAGVGFLGFVRALNVAGLGPVRADLSGPELRRAALRAMGEVVRRLGIEAKDVLFGHTHRAGPLPGDDQAEWAAPGGARLHNTGSWVHERFLLGPTAEGSPYWPGHAVRVGDDGTIEHRRLLAGRSRQELSALPA